MWPTSPGSRRWALAIAGASTLAAVASAVTAGAARSVFQSPVTAASPATFARDIAPILYAHCATCHHEGGSAPFPLVTYAHASRRATQIAEVTGRRYMPPWKPEPNGSAEFVGANRLSDAQIATIARWVRLGAPEGDARLAPRPPAVTGGWRLGTPDLVVSPAEPLSLGPDGTDAFRIFVIPLETGVQRYVRGLEFRPGNGRAVHHANIRVDRTRTSRQFDEADPAPGYDGLVAHTAVYPDGHFLGWTPGQVPPLLPKGLAWRLEPGTDLVVELHVQPTGKAETVKPEIGLYFGSDPPARTPAMLRLGKQDIDIPAGAATHTIHDSFVLPVDATLHAVQPHAHQRARRVRATATTPGGRVMPVLAIDDWDFRWQDAYRLAAPVALPKGTTLAMTITYDNSADNPRNPWRPPRQVFWGQRSAEEMGDVWFQLVARSDSDRERLLERIRPKILTEDTFGYEREIARDPTSMALRDSAAMLYLELGNPAKAVEHFAAAAAQQPGRAAAHFNLGTALSLVGRFDDAVAALTRALALNPNYGQAHNNLGSLLRQRGDVSGARAHFRDAVRADAGNAEAHRNLAALSRDEGDAPAAIAHLRAALRARPEWVPALSDLAWLLATGPGPVGPSGVEGAPRGPEEAVRLAERASELTGAREPAVLDVLAAAYAAAGDFPRAIATAEAALTYAPPGVGAAAIRARLDLYRRGRTFSER